MKRPRNEPLTWEIRAWESPKKSWWCLRKKPRWKWEITAKAGEGKMWFGGAPSFTGYADGPELALFAAETKALEYNDYFTSIYKYEFESETEEVCPVK